MNTVQTRRVKLSEQVCFSSTLYKEIREAILIKQKLVCKVHTQDEETLKYRHSYTATGQQLFTLKTTASTGASEEAFWTCWRSWYQ